MDGFGMIPAAAPKREQRSRAFTIVDLSALLSVLSLAAFLAHPAFASNRSIAKATVCLANLRLLQNAWQLYTTENDGRYIQNFHGAGALGGAAAQSGDRAPWAVGWLNWDLRADNTNLAFIREEPYSKLAPYFTAERNIHKCPADRYLSPQQRARGWKERVRSVVLNGTIGDGNAVTGPWDAQRYVQVKSAANLGLTEVPPASLNGFLEEHPDSINDPFFFPPRATSWIDLAASYHGGAGTLSFLDGHVELHSWKASARRIAVRFNFFQPQVPPGDLDVEWLRTHSAIRRAP